VEADNFMKLITITSIIFLCLLSSCSNGIKKSPLQIEAEQRTQQWFDNSFAKCDDTLVARYNGEKEIHIGSKYSSSMRKGFLQFKALTFLIEEKPLSEADKLNGIEWKGNINFIPIKPTLRYYDDSEKKWSDWQENVVFYSPDLFLPSSEVTSPFLKDIKKVKGNWTELGKNYDKSDELVKPQCSDVPK